MAADWARGAAGSAKRFAGTAAGFAGSAAGFAADHGASAAQFAADRGRLAVSHAILGKEMAKATLLDMSVPIRRKMLTSLKQMLKEQSVADPDMWHCVKGAICSIYDYIFADIEWEIERTVEVALLKQKVEEEAEGADRGILGSLCCICCSFRSCILHHYLPHDRSIFGKIKDCVWWLITIITILPVYGARVAIFSLILLLLLVPGPPDEYQLINYILTFKGTQFFTSGFVMTFVGAMRYFVCFSWFRDSLLNCIETAGPGSFESLWGELADYIGSILLVWIAFCVLPCSAKVEQKAYLGHSLRKGAIEDEEHGCDCCGGSRRGIASKRGGRLRRLLWYDMVTFIISLLVLVALTASTCGSIFTQSGFTGVLNDIQFTVNLYWCRVLYALLSLPFAIFIIPVINTVLTHSDPTGFNAQGECVPFALPADGGVERGLETESAVEIEMLEEAGSSSDEAF